MAMTQDELLALIEQAAAENWTELDLSGQGLTALPPEIGKLTQLESLILGRWAKDELGDPREAKARTCRRQVGTPGVWQ
jgi:internalin A